MRKQVATAQIKPESGTMMTTDNRQTVSVRARVSDTVKTATCERERVTAASNCM